MNRFLSKIICKISSLTSVERVSVIHNGKWSYDGHLFESCKDPKGEYWDYWKCARCGHERGCNGDASIFAAKPLNRK